MTNAILPEAASAHVEELSDPYLLWFWNSNVRSTAIVAELDGQGRRRRTRRYARIVRWLLQARARTALGQHAGERARARGAGRLLPALRVDRPRTSARSSRSATAPLAREQFRGASTDTRSTDIPMTKLLAVGTAGHRAAADLHPRRAQGTLFYSARLRYAADRLFQQGLDQGIRIERSYAPYVETGTSLRRRRSRPAISCASR